MIFFQIVIHGVMTGFVPNDYRSKIVLIASAIALVLLTLSWQLMKTTDVYTTAVRICFITAFYGTIFLTWDSLLTFIELTIEYSELSHASVSFWSALCEMFKFNIAAVVYSTICIVLFLILVITQRTILHEYISNANVHICLPCILLAWLLLRITNFKSMNYSSCQVDALRGLDYGTGMAYSYYYGYLRIVLPSTGTASKGLFERMEDFESNENVTFATKKMHILIPSSGYIPPDLRDVSFQWMESAINLEAEVRDRAGVKQRSYKNNVYKIYPDGPNSNSSPVYVVAEGATPLLTLYEIQRHAHPDSEMYRKYMPELVEKFYNKLKELVENDPECADLCELMYYKDKTEDGMKVNVAKLILQRLPQTMKPKLTLT